MSKLINVFSKRKQKQSLKEEEWEAPEEEIVVVELPSFTEEAYVKDLYEDFAASRQDFKKEVTGETTLIMDRLQRVSILLLFVLVSNES